MHQTQESPERPLPTPQSPRLLRGTLRSSLRSSAKVEATQGFLPQPEKELESPSSTRLEALDPSRALFQGNLPNPGIEPRSPALQADSLPSEPPEKNKNTGVGSLFLVQWIFPTQKLKESPALQVDSLPPELLGKSLGSLIITVRTQVLLD